MSTIEIDTDPDLGPGWLDRIHRYRHNPTAGAGEEIVRLLLPQLRRVTTGYRSLPLALEREDVLQQLVVEVLAGADQMRLPANPEWIPRRLVLRARTYVARWLALQARHQLLPLEGHEASASSDCFGAGRTGAAGPPVLRPEFKPRTNHAWPTQKPRSSGTFGGRHLWIKKVEPEKARRTTS
jgi:hypothetical protein